MATEQKWRSAFASFWAFVRRLGSQSSKWYRQHTQRLLIGVLVALLVFIYLIPLILVHVYPGEAGVMWKRFLGGTDTKNVLGEGLHLKFPWDLAYIYDIRMQTETNTFNVLAEDGLNMEVEVTVRFRPNPRYLGLLHKNIGPDYVQRLVIPEVAAHGREQMAQLRPADIYTRERQRVQQRILETLTQALDVEYLPEAPGESFIFLQDVLIRNITLPPLVAEAIQEKLVQKHKLLAYEYRLQKEEKEKERKQIEGEGIQLFQNMVTEGISEQFLKWKGINATLELAKSNNSKIVIIGAGEGGLPIILGNLGAPPLAAADKMRRSSDEEEIMQAITDAQGAEPTWSMDKP